MESLTHRLWPQARAGSTRGNIIKFKTTKPMNHQSKTERKRDQGDPKYVYVYMYLYISIHLPSLHPSIISAPYMHLLPEAGNTGGEQFF